MIEVGVSDAHIRRSRQRYWKPASSSPSVGNRSETAPKAFLCERWRTPCAIQRIGLPTRLGESKRRKTEKREKGAPRPSITYLAMPRSKLEKLSPRKLPQKRPSRRNKMRAPLRRGPSCCGSNDRRLNIHHLPHAVMMARLGTRAPHARNTTPRTRRLLGLRSDELPGEGILSAE